MKQTLTLLAAVLPARLAAPSAASIKGTGA